MKLEEIKSAQDVYDFIDENIEYGWIDINGIQHLNTMKEFRRIYRILSVDEILYYKIGTCIEQVNLKLVRFLFVQNFKNTAFYRINYKI